MYKILKYIFFGGLSALIEFLSYALLKQFINGGDFQIGLISAISFSLGLISSFLFNKFLVFQKKDKQSKEVFQFICLGLVNLIISSTLTVLLSKIIDPIFAKIVTMALIVVWNFLLMNFVIFKKTPTKLSPEKSEADKPDK